MYLDPGFGSMVIQLLLASLAVVATTLGVFRAKIKAFFKSKKKNEIENENTEEVEEKVDGE